MLDKDEDCEPELNDHCTQTCECESKFEPDLISPGLCVDTCGNGKFEPSHEACDKAMDENCNVECSACNNNMVPDHTGSCTLCGNKHLDAGEQCDSALDRTNCADNCQCMHNTIPSPGAYGTCHDHCGDHIFQPQLEQCEISFENPQHCHPKRCECINQFKPNGVGTCINCGNQVVDLPGENCDNTLDQHCDSALCVCENGFTPTGPTSNCVLANCPNDEETCCGDGKYDKDKEECDYTYIIDSNCAKDSCTCTSPYVLDGYGGCQHHCGDGRFQPQLEMCDKVLDPLACSDDCQSCSSLQDGRVFVEDREGRCTLCGNGIADQHEVCDANLDPDNCDMRLCTCVGKLPGEKGVCSSLNSCECGNNLFEPDSGEMCDGSQHCRENLCICEKGFYPDGTGACVTSMCGDQIVAVGSGEECDGGAHCSSTCKCEKGYTPFGVNGCGDVCGNGIRTGDEQCDPAGSDERTCTSQCRCAANFMPTNPLSSVCIHVSSACGNGMLDASEQCDSGSHCSKDCKCEYGFFAVVSDGVSENKDASKTGAKAVTIAGGYGCNSICGDYFVSADEQCDGGDHCVKDKCVCEKGYTPSKGKSIGCEPVCGDGKVVRGEHCDGGEGCDEHCYCKVSFTALTPPGKDCEKACGNGRLDHNEFCDGGAHCTKECRCEQCHEPDTLYSSSLSPTTTQKNPGCRSIPNCVCDGDNKQHLPLEEKMKKALSDKNSVSEASAGTTGDSTNNVFGTPTIPNSVNGDTPISISGKISSRNANGDTLLPSSTDQKTQGKSRISSSTTLSTTKMKSNALGAPSPNKSSLKTRPPPASPMSIVLPKMNGGNGKNTRKRNSKAGKTVGASSDYNADFPALSGSQTASPPPSSTKKPTGTRLTGTKKASTGSSSGSLGYDTNFPSLPGSRLASSVSSTNAKKKRTYAEVVKGVPAMIQSAAKSAAKITTPSDSLHASLSSLTSMAEHSPLHTVREHLSALLQSRNKDSSATSSDNLTSAVLLETITSTSSPSSPSTMSALRRRFKVNKQKNVLHI